MPNAHRLVCKIMTTAKTIRWSFRLSQWEPSSSNGQDLADWSKILSSIQPEEIERINGYYFKESAKSAAIGRLMIRELKILLIDLIIEQWMKKLKE
uniref:4'-phosphopantetheinyl transferase N-terminal domain-containing protein n=1 Tax=Romanomermis culicivorax TaxID=13658 RepID=A0A915INY7_ROMCU